MRTHAPTPGRSPPSDWTTRCCLPCGVQALTGALPLLYTMYNKQKRRGLCHGLVLPAGVGMALTVCCPFDFERHTLWLLHCIGSLAFSVLSGVAIFLCFLFSFKKGRFWQCATVFWAALMIGDLILLLIYKETGLIEAMPVLTGVVLLNIAIYQKEKVTAYAA